MGRTVETQADAVELQKAINDALDAVTKPQMHDMGAINWADLGCTDVEVRQSLLHPDHPQLVAAIIEEASPDATGLHEYIGKILDKQGWEAVYVVTEW